MSLIRISRRLSREVDAIEFGSPVEVVLNPLVYAREPYERYVERWARTGLEAVLIGMNPGPFGMAQTGVPFGDVERVTRFLEIEGRVKRPPREHPKRPVRGFDIGRKEVSGQRLWGWAEQRFGTADRFFSRVFVLNYCPLVFLEASGRNRTPDKLPAPEREKLFAACDRALRDCVESLAPRFAVGIGAFAAKRAKDALAGLDVRVGRILHPSPASPAANRGWAPQADRQLTELGIEL